jgi:hypothetical protein
MGAVLTVLSLSGVPRNFVRVQQIQLTEGTETGLLGGGSRLVTGSAQFANE